MGFTKKTWKNRIAEYINRRLLTNEDGSTNLVTVARDEGTISQEGDAFNAANMNDLEDRIEAGFEEINQSLTKLNEEIVRYTDYHGFGDNSTFNNVKSGSIIFIRGSGNDYYYFGFVCEARIITMLNNGFIVMPTYDYNSKQLTLMPGAYYYIII